MYTKLAQAAALVPSLQLGMSARGKHKVPKRLDSPLLLRWAVHMGCFLLPERVYSLPGLAQLLAAAANATKLHMECSNVEAAAQADLLMCSCSSVTRLELAGAHLPGILPLTVKRLLVRFETNKRDYGIEYDARQANIMLDHAARLPLLEELHLHFSPDFKAMLTFPIQLGHLETLELTLSLTRRLNLGWVISQPCSCLAVAVACDRYHAKLHAIMVQQLSRCQLSSLTLQLHDQFTPACQSVWGQLAVKESLHIVGMRRGVSGVDNFAREDDALLMLPRCANTLLDFAAQLGLFVWNPETFMSAGVSRAPAAALAACGVWRRGCARLTPSQPTDEAYLLQNAAARCRLDRQHGVTELFCTW